MPGGLIPCAGAVLEAYLLRKWLELLINIQGSSPREPEAVNKFIVCVCVKCGVRNVTTLPTEHAATATPIAMGVESHLLCAEWNPRRRAGGRFGRREPAKLA